MRHANHLVALLALTLTAAASADMCVSRWTAGAKGPHPNTVKVESAADGDVITIDLSALPAGAEVHRARLYVGGPDPELRAPARLPKNAEPFFAGADVYMLKAAYSAGKAPQLAEQPVPAAGPHFECLDVTEVVRQWASGKAMNFGLYARNIPAWDQDATGLEIAWDAKGEKLPPQVTGVSVIHRAGQSFITWKDAEDKSAGEPVTWGHIRDYLRDADQPQVRYRVYRHDQPITPGTIAAAQLIAEVKPFSGYNVNSWSLERLVNQVMFSNEDQGELGKYGAFDGWGMWSPQGGRLVIERFAIEDGKPLPPATGLHVHSPDKPGKAYYAVTAMVDGVENCGDFSANVAGAVEEKPAPWQPVRQGEGGGFGYDFRGQRRCYVQWAGAPLAPRALAFNWSVHVPAAMLEKDFPADRKLPVELYFHGPGLTHARPPVKFIEDSIQIAPHDFPFSGWYGFNDAAGTLRNYAKSTVRAYTQRRIAAFMQWAQGQFPVDPRRVVAVGGDGAAMTALHQPDMLAYVLITGFENDALNAKTSSPFAVSWGPASPDIKDEKGLAEWNWAQPDVLLTGTKLPRALGKDQPAPPYCEASVPGWKTELPFFVIRGVTWGHDPGYVRGRGRLLFALQATGHGQWAHWAWGGRLQPPAKHSGLWQGVDLTNVTAFPAIAYSSADKEGEGSGNCNAGYTWKGVQDEAGKFEVTIAGPQGTFDVTPRRCQSFKLKPGEKVAYTVKTIPADARGGATTQPSEKTEELTAGASGLVTVKGVELVRGAAAVSITLSKK